MKLTELAIGKLYPLKLMQTGEGAATQFLLKGGNILQIVLSGMSADEIWSLKKGTIKGGFLYDSRGCLLWLFTFHDRQNKPLFTFDCPFDATLIPRDEIALHSIENEKQRLAIEIHAIDEKRIVRALRLITLSNKMTIDFLSAVQDQLTAHHDHSAMSVWMAQSIDDLAKKCKMEKLGE
ncbi:MAG: hypothetical protein LV471_09230 [Nitrosomonas sp.]|nr:hypothetical protein [Nitrosomonas sp.]